MAWTRTGAGIDFTWVLLHRKSAWDRAGRSEPLLFYLGDSGLSLPGQGTWFNELGMQPQLLEAATAETLSCDGNICSGHGPCRFPAPEPARPPGALRFPL